MSAIAKPIPLPVNWNMAITASSRANPAMNSANSRAHGWSVHRPSATRIQIGARRDREPAPQPDVLEGRQIAERTEPIEPDDPQAEEQVREAGEEREEAEERDEDGRVLHMQGPSTKDGADRRDGATGAWHTARRERKWMRRPASR